MRIRIRFTKRGPVRYVGHLDFMRCFQKGIKKSGLSALYSAGFSPHMLMSFAAPLAIGEETLGDYVDVDFAFRDPYPLSEQEAYRLHDMGLVNEDLPLPPSSAEFLKTLGEAMPEGVEVTDACRVGLIKGSKAMALVRYADYDLLYAPEPDSASKPFEDALSAVDFMNSSTELMIRKKTKKSERDVDIRPMIVSFSGEKDPSGALRFSLRCASGSSENLKPATVMEVFCEKAGIAFDPYALFVTRRELLNEEMKTLAELGMPF